VNARISLTALALSGAAGLATSAYAQAPAAAPAPEDKKVETFATLPTADANENICQQKDGSIYISVIDGKKILKVTPDGKVSEFASEPMMANVLGLGCGDNEVAALVYGKTFRGGPNPNPPPTNLPLHFDDTDTHIYVFDLTGKMTADIPGQKGDGFNGFAYSGTPGLYYAGNSNSGSISTVDTKAKKISVWWSDPSFGPAGTSVIGINGVRAKNGWVYFSAPTKKGLWKIQIAADGKPSGQPVQIESTVNADDFDVAANGDVYFPAGTVLYKAAAADGALTKVADPIQGGPSALISGDGKWVYWPTRGGTADQRLLRVAIP
jgi:hypothetical protein